ncbi:MAG: hypothetical protein J6I89_02365 [Oscillospiraceae bacterium]|nr:hypothetical protein [Oscillospiraceae bacterium]
MKKFFALLLCLLMVISMVACGTNTANDDTSEQPSDTTSEEPTDTSAEDTTEEPTDAPVADVSLEDLANTLYNGIPEDQMPMVAGMPIEDAEMFEYYAFIPYIEGAELYVSEPMIGSIAHSVVLLKLPEGTDVETVKADLEAKADPRKWICVEAEQVTVTSHDNVVMLVMSTADMAAAVVANFEAYWG